jgi:hypothetical protein
MVLRFATLCSFFLLAWPGPVLPVRGTESDPDVVELRKGGIEPTGQGVTKFLESLPLTPAREARIRSLLADLGSNLFRTRQKAMAELLAIPCLPQNLMEEAAGKDLETRRRVEQILKRGATAECEQRVFLVLRLIERQRLPGLAPRLLELMPTWQESFLTETAARALATTAGPADAGLLRETLARGRSSQTRAAAVTALASALGDKALPDLEQCLADPDSRVCLAAAVPLLNQGKRSPLPVLLRMLETEESETRAGAAAILRAVSGQEIDYAGYDEPKLRAPGVAAWRAWVNGPGTTARLNLPVRPRAIWRGRILIGVYGERLLREIDAATGKTLFEVRGFTYPWGCHATPEGHRLEVDYVGRFIVEYGSRGQECWRKTVPGQPTGIERLENGRTLVALAEPGLVVELDREGKVVWQVTLAGRPTTAQRLENGNTLVCLQEAKRVVEMDRRGKVVWQVSAGLTLPHTAQRLANGHVLVCDMGKGQALEFDRSGKLVWSKTGINNPAQAQRLPNGNTLISGENGLMEFDRQGNQVRRVQVSRSRFCAY